VKDTYKAVEVSTPGELRVVNGKSPSPELVRSGFGWKLAESVTPMLPR
jgi:hypothetical protein